MKKILLCTPRSGSSYTIQWLLNHNKLPKICNSNEPFWKNNPIETLEFERKRGNEYSYKVQIPHIKNYMDWFQSFYTPKEIYILRRKNLWAQYLSYLYQTENDWYMAATKNHNDLRKDPIKSQFYKNGLLVFFTWQSWLDEYDYDTIYYEDIKYDCSNHIKYSEYINYEKYFINIKEIKSYYEILYNWYEEGDWRIIEQDLPNSILIGKM